MDHHHNDSGERILEVREEIRKHQKTLEGLKTLQTALIHQSNLHHREERIRAEEASIKNKEAELTELQETLRELEICHVNNTRLTDLLSNPKLAPYVESIVADFSSTVAADESREVWEDAKDAYGNVIFQAELDRDNLMIDLGRTLQEKSDSDTKLASTLEAKMKIDEELKHTIEAGEKSKKHKILVWPPT